MEHRWLPTTVVLFILGVAATAAATTVAVEPMVSEAQGDIHFISGGVGHAEQKALMKEARDHDMLVTFAQDGGAYLSSVKLRLVNERGREVLNIVTRGPLLLLDLPAGKYWLTASLDGWRSARRQFEVGSSHQRLHVTMHKSERTAS